jgi:cytochrome c heme-lyase
VYNQRIDGPPKQQGPLQAILGRDDLSSANQMPVEPNQQPCPGQKKLLSTERVASTIPKGGTDGSWLYPSPQMFFNGVLAHMHCITQPFTTLTHSRRAFATPGGLL